MQSMNRQCNMLASTIGIFLHSCNTPVKVTKILSLMGVSISTKSIHNMINSLSRDSQHSIRSLSQTLTAAYAYDNFDVDLKKSVPTVENSTDTLIHMTSGDLMQLEHVSAEELRCSQLLWEASFLNPLNIFQPQRSYRDLFSLHPEQVHPTGLT
jgi:hypothetical protein